MKAIYLALIIGWTLTNVDGQHSRIWTIRVFPVGNLHYINDEGILAGVGIDLIDLVCKEAAMDCRVMNAPVSLCWQRNGGEHPSGGPALMRGSIDACSFVHTPERDLIFKFSLPMYKAFDAYLYVLKGQSLDPDNLQGKTIGFRDGAFTNVRCLAQYSKNFGTYPHLIKHYPGHLFSAAVDDMRNGKLDGFFGVDVFVASHREELRKSSGPYACYIGGVAMMSRKDSAFTANWNVGLTKLKNTNRFEKFCEEANARHSLRGKTICVT